MRDTATEPGEESAIVIDYTVKSVAGEQVFEYRVKSNDPAAPEKLLTLKLYCVTE